MGAHENMIPGTLIICGAPQPAVRAARQARLAGWPERVVLLEPLGAAKLGAAAPLLTAPGLELISALPGPEDGEADLTLYSLPGLRSLSPALPVLLDLFPGLSERETRPVEILSGASLQERLGGLIGPVHLWIDMPGAESQALDAFEAAGLLEQAETVTLRCGSEPFFDGASDCAALRARLEALCFEMATRDDADPDWPDLVMRQDVVARAQAQLRDMLDAREAELHELRGVTGLKASEIETLQQTLDETIHARQQDAEAFQQELATREGTIGELRGHIAAHIEEAGRLNEQIELRGQQLSERKIELDAVSLHASELQGLVETRDQQLAERDREIERLEGEKAQAAGAAAQLRQETATKSERIAALTKEVERLKGVVETTRQKVNQQNSTLTQRDTELAKKTLRIQDMQTRLQEQNAAASALEQQLADLRAARNAALQQRDQAQADQGLQMRMQAMHKMDLDDLRIRYEQSETRRRQQEELLRKLTPRLAQAAEQLRHLQLPSGAGEPAVLQELADDPEIVPVDPAPKKARTTKAKGKKPAKSTKRKARKGDAK